MSGKAYMRVWAVAGWIVILFMVAPLIVIVLGSFTSREYLSLPYEPSLRWYADLMDRPRFIDGFIKSMELGIAAAFLATVLGTGAAIALSRRSMPGAGAFALVFMMPIMVPSVVISIALLQFFNNLRINTPYVTLFVGHTIITLPYVVRTVTASLVAMPRKLEWAAANLGASPWRIVWSVVLPNILPGVAGSFIFAFVVSFDTVTVSVFLLNMNFIPLPVRLYDFIQTGVSPVLAAVSTLLMLFTALAVYAAERIAGFEAIFGARR
jgi:putative spermidine/putrescine transport system permease protein